MRTSLLCLHRILERLTPDEQRELEAANAFYAALQQGLPAAGGGGPQGTAAAPALPNPAV